MTNNFSNTKTVLDLNHLFCEGRFKSEKVSALRFFARDSSNIFGTAYSYIVTAHTYLCFQRERSDNRLLFGDRGC